MRKRRLLAGLAVAAGLGIGGLAGIVLGVPSVSAAQTTTVPPAADEQAPTTPADPGAQPPADRPPHDDAGCPNMGGESDGTGAPGAAAFHRGPRGGGATRSL